MNVHALKIIPVCLLIVVMAGCWPFGEKKPSNVADQMSLRVINVLGEDLHKDAHIKGSINIPYETVESKSSAWNKNVPVVVYCSNYQCSASGEVAKKLAAKGFTTYAYEGGTAEWYQLGKKDSTYALEGPARESYLEMVIEPLQEEDADVKVISAVELKKMMQNAGLLK
jgi:rhodanese-related sulfurtransferase